MNISLVVCPNPVLHDPTAHFPLGILYVARALRDVGQNVQIVDLRANHDVQTGDIPKADVVGVTATSGEAHWAKQIAQIARKKGARTMIGGAHATFMASDCLADFDYVIQGDGEIAAPNALASRMPGLYSVRLPSLAGHFPAWGLVGERGFSHTLFTGAGYGYGPKTAGLLSSRGCPHRCSYCRSEREVVRYRPIDEVVGEIKMLQRLWGVHHFRLYDETFTVNKKRALELLEALEPLEIRLRANTRADVWDDDLAAAFKRAGGDEMGFGFEAASDHVLQKIRKQETVAQFREAVRVCKRNGVLCKAFWMSSLPGQGWAEVEDIKKFMLSERPEKWILSRFCAYPGSDVWARPEAYGVKWMSRDLSKFWNFSDEPLIEYEDMGKDELQRQYHYLNAWLEREFPR